MRKTNQGDAWDVGQPFASYAGPEQEWRDGLSVTASCNEAQHILT
jgi:hypothetical protein